MYVALGVVGPCDAVCSWCSSPSCFYITLAMLDSIDSVHHRGECGVFFHCDSADILLYTCSTIPWWLDENPRGLRSPMSHQRSVLRECNHLELHTVYVTCISLKRCLCTGANGAPDSPRRVQWNKARLREACGAAGSRRVEPVPSAFDNTSNVHLGDDFRR